MNLKKSLAYPFTGNGWFSRLLILTVIQFVPIIGQLILIGYGLEIVRSANDNDHQSDLPALHGWQAVGDGLRIVAAGLLYLVPILAVAPMILTIGTSQADAASGGGNSTLPIVFAVVVMAVVLPGLGRVVKQKPKLQPVITAVGGLMMLVLVGSTISSLVQMQSDLSLTDLKLNGIGILQLVLLIVFGIIIYIGVQIAAIRYALTGKGLIQPEKIIQLMIHNRKQTTALILNVLLLNVVSVLAIGLGFLALVIPGLFLIVVFSIVQWHLFAFYSVDIGLKKRVPLSRL